MNGRVIKLIAKLYLRRNNKNGECHLFENQKMFFLALMDLTA